FSKSTLPASPTPPSLHVALPIFVYSYARRIIYTIEECQSALENLTTPGYGRLTIGAVSTVAMFTLPELLGAFAKQQPLVTVHVRSEEHTSQLQSRENLVCRLLLE